MTGTEFSGLAMSASSCLHLNIIYSWPTFFSFLLMQVKHEWARALLAVKQLHVFVSMRARIALWKHGCIPLEEKKKEEALIDEEIDSVKSNKGRLVDAGDIIGALDRGDEVGLFCHFSL